MNIDNYRVFIRVAKIGNLTAAAEQLGYTQSGISHIVSALEQEFGFQLLRRSKTGVSLTQEGERILQTLREVVNRDDMLKQIAAEIKGVRMGKVRVGAFSSVAVCWLPKIIAEFSNEYPNISIDELRIALDVTDRTIARYISELKDKGIIERKGPDNGGKWKIR